MKPGRVEENEQISGEIPEGESFAVLGGNAPSYGPSREDTERHDTRGMPHHRLYSGVNHHKYELDDIPRTIVLLRRWFPALPLSVCWCHGT